jgi:hypothetical protein
MVIVELTPFEECSCECANLIVKAMRRHEVMSVFSTVQVAASNITAAGTIPETREYKR